MANLLRSIRRNLNADHGPRWQRGDSKDKTGVRHARVSYVEAPLAPLSRAVRAERLTAYFARLHADRALRAAQKREVKP